MKRSAHVDSFIFPFDQIDLLYRPKDVAIQFWMPFTL